MGPRAVGAGPTDHSLLGIVEVYHGCRFDRQTITLSNCNASAATQNVYIPAMFGNSASSLIRLADSAHASFWSDDHAERAFCADKGGQNGTSRLIDGSPDLRRCLPSRSTRPVHQCYDPLRNCCKDATATPAREHSSSSKKGSPPRQRQPA